jgi:hypothetical protein
VRETLRNVWSLAKATTARTRLSNLISLDPVLCSINRHAAGLLISSHLLRQPGHFLPQKK